MPVWRGVIDASVAGRARCQFGEACAMPVWWGLRSSPQPRTANRTGYSHHGLEDACWLPVYADVANVADLRNSDMMSLPCARSQAYQTAAVASWCEYGLRQLLVTYPSVQKVAMAGVAMCVLGDGLRKAAMYTAGANFTHMVAFSKTHGHELVTNGVQSNLFIKTGGYC